MKPEDIKLKLSEWQEVTRIIPDNVRLEENYSLEYLGMLQSLDAQLYRRDIQHIVGAKTIWDAFKYKFFPKWLLRRFPSSLIEVDFRILYPEISKDGPISSQKIKEATKYPVATKREQEIEFIYDDLKLLQ